MPVEIVKEWGNHPLAKDFRRNCAQRGPWRQASKHSLLATALAALRYCRHEVQGRHCALLPVCSTAEGHSRSFGTPDLVDVDGDGSAWQGA